jgi:hypothetical protein
MSAKYILDGHKPKPERDLLTWARWFEDGEKRRVAHDVVGLVSVSTVFLGIDHQFGNGPPLLFETMTFGPSDDGQEQHRYSTWDEAVAGHNAIVGRLKNLLSGRNDQ